MSAANFGLSLVVLRNVPLFSGFMYASVGSYIARVIRIFDMRFAPYPPFWATVLLLVIVVTQRPLKGIFRKIHNEEFSFRRGIDDLIAGLVAGGRNMIGIGVATAAAGIVVGTVTLTGIALVMTEFVEFISLGNMTLTLIFTALFSIILGMGLPTTANYIVVSTLMAPVIVSLGAQSGLLIPLVAVHLFVFYFGVLADDTPPVGLAAFAAAGISGGDPIRTGIQGFMYDIRTGILPFVFIYNTELLMINIGSVGHFLVVVVGAFIAIMVFASATQGYMLTRNKLWETVLLLLVAFTMFRPGYFWDMIYPELETRPATELEQFVSDLPSGKQLRLTLKGEKTNGDELTMVVSLAAGKKAPAEERLPAMGFGIRNEDEVAAIGINGKMNEFQAAMGLAVLDEIEELHAKGQPVLVGTTSIETWHDQRTRSGFDVPSPSI